MALTAKPEDCNSRSDAQRGFVGTKNYGNDGSVSGAASQGRGGERGAKGSRRVGEDGRGGRIRSACRR